MTVGRNVPEAFSLTYHFERAARAQLQIQAAAAAGAKIMVPSRETCERSAPRRSDPDGKPRLTGQREWPALLRLVDSLDPGYRT